jgi:probable selenium-dependent hydroxylase accessory protein YqeC
VALELDPAVLPPCRGVVFAAKPVSDNDPQKVCGYSPGAVDALFNRAVAPTIIVEADGACRKPLKAPAHHEPVIPANTTVVIGVIGLSCFSGTLTPKTVFRQEYFAAITGLAPGDAVTPESVALLVSHPDGLFKSCPRAAKRLLFLNQCDLPGAFDKGVALAEILFTHNTGFLHAVYIGSVNKERTSCHKVLSA